ncbi:MAG: acyl-ACP thioesterase [Robiginitomaculum sp.]
MAGFTQTWAGEASNWECDELGHLNMRHYVYKASEARQFLCILLGLAYAFKAGAQASVDVKEFHIVYMSEARPGAPLTYESAITQMDESELTAVHIMRHFNGRPACVITERLVHVSRRTGQAFPWPSRLLKRAKNHMADAPDFSIARGLDAQKPSQPITLERADNLGMSRLGMGVFQPDEADIFGRVTAGAIMGRVTQTVGQFTKAWPENFDDKGVIETPIHGALFEARVIFGAQMLPGDGYIFCSGIESVNKNVRSLVHKMFSPITGEVFASMQGVAGLMDLKLRKHVKTSGENLKNLNALIIKDLSI